MSSSRHRLTDLNLKQGTDVSLCLQLAREVAQAGSPTASRVLLRVMLREGSGLGPWTGPCFGSVAAALRSHLDYHVLGARVNATLMGHQRGHSPSPASADGDTDVMLLPLPLRWFVQPLAGAEWHRGCGCRSFLPFAVQSSRG